MFGRTINNLPILGEISVPSLRAAHFLAPVACLVPQAHVHARPPTTLSASTGKNNRFQEGLLQIPIFGYFRVFKEYPQKFQIWKSETSASQGTWLGIPWLGLVSLCQIWDFCGISLNILKYPILGISYFFLCTQPFLVSSRNAPPGRSVAAV